MSLGTGASGSSGRAWDLIREDYDRHGRSRVQPRMPALVFHRLGQAAYAGTTAKHRAGRILYRLGRIVVSGVYSIEIPVGPALAGGCTCRTRTGSC